MKYVRSKSLAVALRDWLPLVLNYVKPWVSDKDIGAGDRWAQSVAGELETSNFGIICITPENLQSEWVLFEAGALSKSMLDAKVIPLLFGLELSDLSGPLSQFQAQKVELTGIMEVVRSINNAADNKVSEDIILRIVPPLWPTLQAELDKIPETRLEEKHMRPQHEILEELVSGVRGLNARMLDFGPDVTERDYPIRRKKSRLNRRILEELSYMSIETNDGPTVLLVLAGLLKDEFPWLTELLVESYREVRDGGPETADRVAHRLHRSITLIMRGSMMRELVSGSKESLLIIEELPMFIDMALRTNNKRSFLAAGKEEESKG